MAQRPLVTWNAANSVIAPTAMMSRASTCCSNGLSRSACQSFSLFRLVMRQDPKSFKKTLGSDYSFLDSLLTSLKPILFLSPSTLSTLTTTVSPSCTTL